VIAAQPHRHSKSLHHLAAGKTLLALCLALSSSLVSAQKPTAPSLPTQQLATQYFGPDAPWFLRNIPFLEIDDPEIQQIYYYRWKLYRSHIREIGPEGTLITEFLTDVPWARHPFTDLNDSSSFHLSEGRWLRDPALIDSLIDHLYTGGGNDRHFSESIAAATFSTTLVTGAPAPAIRHLDTMQYIYNQWDDHFDRARNLYWVEPIADATEYTISSIDASGSGFTDHPSTDDRRNGFTQGFAFRPSINSYQYANALAISAIARLANKPAIAADYTQRAEALRASVLTQLWNPTLQHFTDRYERSTPYVQAGDFIRGRELNGYVPWFYELPPQGSSTDYAQSWRHILSSAELAGPYGLRTVEPSYPRYMTQYRYDRATGQPECQWNGPSWPFQTSQLLTGLANLLNDYTQSTITSADYLHLLRQYTHQHLRLTSASGGQLIPDIEEDYNPDTGSPIVGLPRSHHYNHSTYIDLILSGLIGIRPRADNILEINPLLPTASAATQQAAHPIRFFALDHLSYHGHDISILYDQDGSRYHRGKGLTVFVDHKLAAGPTPLARLKLTLPTLPAPIAAKPEPADLAVNVGVPGFPIATASSSLTPESIAEAASEAIDGRLWFSPEIPNGWSPSPAASATPSWYAVDFGQPRLISTVELYVLDNATGAHPSQAPTHYTLEAKLNGKWQEIPTQHRTPTQPLAGGLNQITFPPITTSALRILFDSPTAPATFRLLELKAFAPQ